MKSELIEYKCDVCGKDHRFDKSWFGLKTPPLKEVEVPIKTYDCEGRNFSKRMGKIDMCDECFKNYWEFVQSRYDISDYYGVKVKS